VLRGCVTSGEQWIFFLYNSADNGGGHVSCSEEYSIGSQFEGLPLILGLLHDWVSKFRSDYFRRDTDYPVHRWTTLLIHINSFSPLTDQEYIRSCWESVIQKSCIFMSEPSTYMYNLFFIVVMRYLPHAGGTSVGIYIVQTHIYVNAV
jgi:hypothetical protein